MRHVIHIVALMMALMFQGAALAQSLPGGGLGGAMLPDSAYPGNSVQWFRFSQENPITITSTSNRTPERPDYTTYVMSDAPEKDGKRTAVIRYSFSEPIALSEVILESMFKPEDEVAYKFEIYEYNAAKGEWEYTTHLSDRVTGLRDVFELPIPGRTVARHLRISFTVPDGENMQSRGFVLDAVKGFRFWGVDPDGDGCCLLCDPSPGNPEVTCHNAWPSTDPDNPMPCRCFCCDHSKRLEVEMSPGMINLGSTGKQVEAATQGNYNVHYQGEEKCYSPEEAYDAMKNGGSKLAYVVFNPMAGRPYGGFGTWISSHVAKGWNGENDYYSVYEVRSFISTHFGGQEVMTGKGYLRVKLAAARETTATERITFQVATVITSYTSYEENFEERKREWVKSGNGIPLWSGTMSEYQALPADGEFRFLPIDLSKLRQGNIIVMSGPQRIMFPTGEKEFRVDRDIQLILGEDKGEIAPVGGETEPDDGADDGTGGDVTEGDYVPPDEDPDIPDTPSTDPGNSGEEGDTDGLFPKTREKMEDILEEIGFDPDVFEQISEKEYTITFKLPFGGEWDDIQYKEYSLPLDPKNYGADWQAAKEFMTTIQGVLVAFGYLAVTWVFVRNTLKLLWSL